MEDKFILPFGKYKGEYLCDLPTSYLEWIENNIESKKIKELASKELTDREINRNYVGGDSN
jgi:uncharacterized protein (DUF3820 family)